MENIIAITNQLMASMTLGGQLIVAVIVLSLVFRGRHNGTIQYIERNGLKLVFLIALGAVLVSLFYSNYIGFPPCTLCWWQRIFMYGILIVSGVAVYKKGDTAAIDYLIWLTVFGTLVALDHVYLENTGISLLPCDATAVSCSERFVYEYGYITIPVMSLTGFAMIATILGIKKTARNA
ncbi:MAG: disulfide bond formation protein B [Patescibacteria group bacterium]